MAECRRRTATRDAGRGHAGKPREMENNFWDPLHNHKQKNTRITSYRKMTAEQYSIDSVDKQDW